MSAYDNKALEHESGRIPSRGTPLPSASSAIIFKYNPHRMPPEEVLGTFCERDDLLGKLISHIRDQAGARKPSHLFLYGPRGMGKTTMLLALRHTISRMPGLACAYDVIQFSEEERRIANLPAFAIRTLELLVQRRPSLADDLERARSEPGQAFEVLLESVARESERKALLLIDNFDEVVIAAVTARTKLIDAGRPELTASMCHFLDSPHFLVVATALEDPSKRKNFPEELLSAFGQVDKLAPIDDAMTFLRKRAERDRREGFLEQLPTYAARIDGLNRLAGGNPRLLVFLYDCLGIRPLADLVEIVQRTVDELTPMYQDVLDRLLTRGQAAVLEMLVAEGGVGRVEQVAQRTYQDTGTVRDALNKLHHLGLVERQSLGDVSPNGEGPRKGTVFRVQPALFQIWYEMRHLDSEESLYLVRFFSILTAPREARSFLGELRSAAGIADRAAVATLMEEVADVLDPDWEALRKSHVYDVLAADGSYEDALEKLDKAMEQLAPDAIQRRIGHLVVRSSVKRHLGQIEPAEEDLLQAEELATKSVQHETRVKVLVARSAHLQTAGRTKQALKSAEKAVDLANTLFGVTAKDMQASALLELASALDATSDSAKAREYANRADALLGVDYPGRLKWRALSLRGMIERKLGAPEQSKTLLEAALTLSLRQGWKRERATSISNLGAGYLEDGEYRQARQLLGEALTIKREVGDRRGEAIVLGNLATAHSEDGKYDRARELYEEALAIKREVGDRRGEAISQLGLASLYARIGKGEMARQIYQEAVAAFRQSGDRANEATVMVMVGRLALRDRMWDEALEHIGKAHEMFVTILRPTLRRQSARDLAGVHFDIAVHALEQSDEETCWQHVGRATKLAEDAGASAILSLLLNRLVLPALKRSENTASPLLSQTERLKRKPVFVADLPVLDSIERTLRYFAEGRSKSPLVDADPTQMALIMSLIDTVDRPQHLEARQLWNEGKLDEAQQVLENILQRSPDDGEATINLVSILVRKREFEAAEQRMQSASAIVGVSKPGVLLRAEIEAGLGRAARAIHLLEEQISCEPVEPMVYAQLASLLRSEQRFMELAQLLPTWREHEVDSAKHEAISVLVVEAHVLAGSIEIARAKLPDATFLPESPNARLLLRFLRVLFALLDQDGDRSRRDAVEVLEEATNLAPEDLSHFITEDLMERAKELLPDREYRFLMALGLAAQQRVDPMQFSSEYLTKQEARTLVDRFSEESERARGELRKGELPGFEEIVRRSTRSIGPAAAIRALGEAWAELDDERKQRAVQVVLAALESTRDGDVAAALAVVGYRFPELGEDDRTGALEGVLALTGRSEAPQASRVRAVRLLNILYPNLAVPERDRVREVLDPAREALDGPDLQEFFDHTVPAVESKVQV